MGTAGIIAEYNPFHNGHAWQIAELKNAALRRWCACAPGRGARGTAALFPARCVPGLRWPPGRTWCSACRHLRYAVRRGLCSGGVALLSALGCVDALCFGTETRRLEDIAQTAALLESPDFPAALRGQLDAGLPLPAARAAAAEALCPGAGAVLRAPNDILGVEYCKALLRQHSALVPLALPRRGAAHDAPLDAAPGRYASASALRALVRAGGAAALAPHVPPACLRLYMQAEAEGDILDGRAFGIAVLSRLRAMDAAGLRAVGRGRGPGEPARRRRSGRRHAGRAGAGHGQNDMRRRVCAVWCWTRPGTPGSACTAALSACWEQMKRALRYCAAHVRRLCCRCLIRWRIWRPEAPRLRAWQRPMPRPRT
ncbi:MAG: nucleotidyltransferase family protein [Ruthenibacterium lactatiformans]